MTDKPVFVYAAAYATSADAYADYGNLLDLDEADLIDTYDVAIIRKDEHGKVHVEKEVDADSKTLRRHLRDAVKSHS